MGADLYGYMENWHKAKNGQVFTPLHMGRFAAKLMDTDDTDTVLDACCGSGALLFAAHAEGADKLLGIEYDEEVKKLAEENLKNVDDITYEIRQGDSQSGEVSEWIKEKQPTKVILNPPYERKYGCMKIVKNVVDSLECGTKVAIFIPDKKFEKESKKYKQTWNNSHTIDAIIKMPKNLFYGFSVEVSLFLITAGVPQDNKKIYTCYIEDDGLVQVKNKSPQDLKGKWENELKDKYFHCIYNRETETDSDTAKELDAKWIEPSEHLSYQLPEKPFEIHEEDFEITALNYMCFKEGINLDELWKDKYQRWAMIKALAQSGRTDSLNPIFRKEEQ